MSEEKELSTRDLHILGKISGYYGVKGWVKIYSYTQPRENIVGYKSLKIRFGSSINKTLNKKHSSEWQDIKLSSGKVHGKGVVAHFSGYDNREVAAALIGAELAVYRSDFKATTKDEYYWTDLIGLNAVNLDGVEFGQVSRLIETAANDVLVIQNPHDKSETLIPFVHEQYIKEVDLEAGRITVDWPADWNESK